MSATSHAAAASAAGYQYQTWWALWEMLRTGRDRPDATLTIELHDDVAWDAGSSPTELLQTKHHQRSRRTLSDAGDDIWRSLGVWMDTAYPADPEGPALRLVSTDVAAEGSAAYCLRHESRDVPAALARLLTAAKTSTSGRSAQGRRRFLDLGSAGQETFLSRILIIDGSPQLDDIDGRVRRELGWALPAHHEELFMQMLWGWWDGIAVTMLCGQRRGIAVSEVSTKISDLRDEFSGDRLPTLVHLADVNEADVAGEHAERVFVQQLQWIDWPPTNLRKAVVDYYRAYVQTARWVDEDLVALDELQHFEDNLVDEWEREFEFMIIELGDGAGEDDKKRAGATLLRALLDATAVTVRARYDDAFFARGKRHELADYGQIGWHAGFQRMIDESLLAAT